VPGNRPVWGIFCWIGETGPDLERDNRELRRANQILKAATAFFTWELDPQPYPGKNASLVRSDHRAKSERAIACYLLRA